MHSLKTFWSFLKDFDKVGCITLSKPDPDLCNEKKEIIINIDKTIIPPFEEIRFGFLFVIPLTGMPANRRKSFALHFFILLVCLWLPQYLLLVESKVREISPETNMQWEKCAMHNTEKTLSLLFSTQSTERLQRINLLYPLTDIVNKARKGYADPFFLKKIYIFFRGLHHGWRLVGLNE